MGKNDNDPLVAPPDFDGPTSDRHCTDILCTGLILLLWAVMTGLGVYAITNGDYRIVVNPLDYDGNVCGTDYGDIDMTDYPFLYYVNSYTGGVCVKECPRLGGSGGDSPGNDNTTTNTNTTNSNQLVSDGLTDMYTLITYNGIYQLEGSAELPQDYIQVANYSSSDDVKSCILEDGTNVCFPSSGNDANNNVLQASWQSEGINKGFGFAYYVGDTYTWLQRCYLTDAAEDRIAKLVQADNVTKLGADPTYTADSFWNDLYRDIYTARVYILGFGFGVAVVVSFVYIFMMRIPFLLNFVVWSSIFLTIAMFIGAGYYSFRQANIWEDEDPQLYEDRSITAARIASYCLWGLGALFFLIVVCLRKQIQLAIGCVKQASRALNKMPGMIFVPVLQAFGLILFLITLIAYAVFLASLGTFDKVEVAIPGEDDLKFTFRTFEFDDFVENCAWYLLFCGFWTANFIIAVGDMVIAMSVAKWYFTWDKSNMDSFMVCGSIKDTCRYHLGTCAFGSLVIAIVQFIRTIVAKFQKKIKEMDNSVADVLLCCCQCCLWCFEKCIAFINKNAYIQTAIFGTSFCTSAKEAFSLILRNAARIGAISYVSGGILIVGKVFISAVTTGLSYIAILEYLGDELYSVVGPVVFIFLISYFVSDMFMDVFEMATATILQCFIADEEMFQGEQCYAEGDLQKWINKNQE